MTRVAGSPAALVVGAEVGAEVGAAVGAGESAGAGTALGSRRTPRTPRTPRSSRLPAASIPARARSWGRPARTGGDDAAVKTVRRQTAKVGRNDPCPCGSGKKYKKCKYGF